MGKITLRKALDDYKTVYMPYRNFAERTRVEYKNDLENFLGFLEKSGMNHVKELSLPIIERYVANLEQKGLASLTRKRKVVAIRSFLLFLYQDGYIDTNIAKRVVLPFAESSTPHVLTRTECEHIRNACADNPRDRAIIELLLQTGIKLSELVRLTKNDFEFEETTEIGAKYSGFIRILGSRGKKDRIIPVNTKACLELKNYLETRKDTGNNLLFLNRFGEPLGERGVQKMLMKYLSVASIIGANIHSLRHTFGVYHAVKGTSLEIIQEVMGLKDVRSASIYRDLASIIMNKEIPEHAL